MHEKYPVTGTDSVAGPISITSRELPCYPNLMHNVQEIPNIIKLTEHDSWQSILPSCHIFKRTESMRFMQQLLLMSLTQIM